MNEMIKTAAAYSFIILSLNAGVAAIVFSGLVR